MARTLSTLMLPGLLFLYPFTTYLLVLLFAIYLIPKIGTVQLILGKNWKRSKIAVGKGIVALFLYIVIILFYPEKND